MVWFFFGFWIGNVIAWLWDGSHRLKIKPLTALPLQAGDRQRMRGREEEKGRYMAKVNNELNGWNNLALNGIAKDVNSTISQSDIG